MLFTRFNLGGITLANRVVMAPMTRSRAGVWGNPTPLNAHYYAQRASAGLIIAEATQISTDGQGYLRTPGVHTTDQVLAWQQVTQQVHAAGGVIFLQLWHVGRVAHTTNQAPGARVVGPCAIAADVSIYTESGMQPAPVPHALTEVEIGTVVQDYAHAARNAIAAGFDGVEIHAGNGYLIDQFLQAGSNRRTDQYGGSPANRARFLWEVCGAVAAAIGAERTGVRLSPFGNFNGVSDPNPRGLFATAIQGLNDLYLAYLHIINPEVSGDRTARTPAEVDVARFCREHFVGTLMVAGGYDARSAEKAPRDGVAHLIGFGRPYIANPDLVARLKNGRPLAVPDRATFYTTGCQGYTDYPALH